MAESVRSTFPRSIPYIIGNEAAERFSFYGMRNILVAFLASQFFDALPESERGPAARQVFHTFVMGVYFFPLIGGFIADRFFGRYATILWVSLVYCVGHLLLALFDDVPNGFYAGLFLIAMSSGGIKPCVSAFVGDQFDSSQRSLARVVFDGFYWVINFGSFFATLLAPILLARWGPSVAFGVPGVLMALATFIFWLGRNTYVKVAPTPSDPRAPTRLAWTLLTDHPSGRAALWLAGAGALASLVCGTWLGPIPALCLALVTILGTTSITLWKLLPTDDGDEDIAALRSILRLLLLFALVTPFWSLFDQKASTWVLQAGHMTLPSFMTSASQMQSLNPLLVMLLIPINNLVLYPLIRRLGVEPTPLRRMTVGIALSGFAWIVVGCMQLWIDGGATLSIAWQILPYAILTLGEVLVSATGLEFAYSQAPMNAKGTLMSFWSLSVTVGNLWVLLVDAALKRDSVSVAVSAATGWTVTAFQMFFFAGMAFAAATVFGAVARVMPVASRYRSA